MSSKIKTISFWVVLIGLAVFLFAFFRPGQGAKELQIPVSEFVNRVQAGQVKEVSIAGNDVQRTARQRRHLSTPRSPSISPTSTNSSARKE